MKEAQAQSTSDWNAGSVVNTETPGLPQTWSSVQPTIHDHCRNEPSETWANKTHRVPHVIDLSASYQVTSIPQTCAQHFMSPAERNSLFLKQSKATDRLSKGLRSNCAVTTETHSSVTKRSQVRKYKYKHEDILDDNQSVVTTATVSTLGYSEATTSVGSQKAGRYNPRITKAKHKAKFTHNHTCKTIEQNGRRGAIPSSDSERPKTFYPRSFSKVQELVKRLQESRAPVSEGLQPDRSGLNQFSIRGRRNTVDPVLAWSNLSRSERDYQGLSGLRQRAGACSPVTTTCQSDPSSLSDDEGIVSLADDDTENMDPTPPTPLGSLVGDDDVFRYGNYDRRTGQILNYYAEKEVMEISDDMADGRHERCYVRSRGTPSVSTYHRSNESHAGSVMGHRRSQTVPLLKAPGMEPVSPGPVFMGRRVYPPQKIVPSFRPTPSQHRGRTFVQIHKPSRLFPRSNTSDFSYRTNSNMLETAQDVNCYESLNGNRLADDFTNLRIVGQTMRTKQKGTKLNGQPVAHEGRPLKSDLRDGQDIVSYGGESRGSSRSFLQVNPDIRTQMQTISPPFSAQPSSQYLASSTKVSSQVIMEDFCVYNHVNPSPRCDQEDVDRSGKDMENITLKDHVTSEEVTSSVQFKSHINMAGTLPVDSQ